MKENSSWFTSVTTIFESHLIFLKELDVDNLLQVVFSYVYSTLFNKIMFTLTA